ncbi:MAG: NADPH dehydrogenase [Candidatus Omnitrophica bacterium CG22_combo_CG10-13_8_21_14_all_43_16]|nr:MAG: NADPH dehydrogenase [Candidatus Omnitrophica bacterium CG22_combo_CG10-13_8_21_14_all_43_16]
MKVLIVYAHPEPRSFNSAMKELAISLLKGQGHEVKISDLYEMNFKASLGRNDFLGLTNSDHVNYVTELKSAYEKQKFTDDIGKEQEKLLWADFIILQYPLWWFSVPAILKGWFDRVLATGFAWDFGRMYDTGLLAGKKAMLSVTTGGLQAIYAPDTPHGWDINQVLYPVNHGVLYFCGIQPTPPFVAYAVFQVGDEVRKQYLQEYKQRLLTLDTATPISYNRLSDCDENFKLKSVK